MFVPQISIKRAIKQFVKAGARMKYCNRKYVTVTKAQGTNLKT